MALSFNFQDIAQRIQDFVRPGHYCFVLQNRISAQSRRLSLCLSVAAATERRHRPTVTTISLDGALRAPQAFVARNRTKYVPATTPMAV